MLISDAKKVEVIVSNSGKVWINIDDRCAVIVEHAQVITTDDPVNGYDVVYSEDNHEET